MEFMLYKSGIIICYQSDVTTVDISKGEEKLILNAKKMMPKTKSYWPDRQKKLKPAA